jgi:hypothetical protein
VLDQGLAVLAAGVRFAVGVLALANVGPQLLCLEGLRRWSQSTAFQQEIEKQYAKEVRRVVDFLVLANVGQLHNCFAWAIE